jgi:hypothetical protein
VLHSSRFCEAAVPGRSQAWWPVTRRLVGNLSTVRTPARQLSTGVLAKALGSSCACYFTLNVRHAVFAAVCVAVLAIEIRSR